MEQLEMKESVGDGERNLISAIPIPITMIIGKRLTRRVRQKSMMRFLICSMRVASVQKP